MTENNGMPRSVRAFLSQAGKKGGSVSSEAKKKAARQNATLPRPNRKKNKKKRPKRRSS